MRYFIMGIILFGGLVSSVVAANFQVGVGKADITGPAAERGMLGYGLVEQKTAGIHTRLLARAFYLRTKQKEIVLVNCDLAMISPALYRGVMERLTERYPGRFGSHNLLLQATHTHAGPGGYFHLPFYNLSTLGFSQTNFNVIVNGIEQAIIKALKSATPGKLSFASGELLNASYNRSLPAYKKNPDHKNYRHQTHKLMTQLNFWDQQGRPLGILNWFAVHPVSMGNKNRLISGDNKGIAAFLFERDLAQVNPQFVAAFGNSEQGDVSPHSPKQRLNTPDQEKAYQSGSAQFQKAKELWQSSAQTWLKPQIKYLATNIHMPGFKLDRKFVSQQKKIRLCAGAMGQSFAAGAEDGRSEVQGFFEGMTIQSLKKQKEGDKGLWSKLASWLRPLFQGGNEHEKCHAPRAVLLTTGHRQLNWTANTLPFQVIQIGELLILSVPGEMTTMAGRRLRQHVKNKLKDKAIKQVVIAGLANSYSGYIATYEEYQVQHYEGASTLFGPYTANAYLQIYDELLTRFEAEQNSLPPAQSPSKTANLDLVNLQTGVVFDRTPSGKKFGDLLLAPHKIYRPGETVKVAFQSGHPKNATGVLASFAAVQIHHKGNWKEFASDHDPVLTYLWERTDCLGCSQSTILWKLGNSLPSGLYRIVHYGRSKKPLNGNISFYQGKTSHFTIVSPTAKQVKMTPEPLQHARSTSQ